VVPSVVNRPRTQSLIPAQNGAPDANDGEVTLLARLDDERKRFDQSVEGIPSPSQVATKADAWRIDQLAGDEGGEPHPQVDIVVERCTCHNVMTSPIEGPRRRDPSGGASMRVETTSGDRAKPAWRTGAATRRACS
jgi:hypothetical protein